jgi:hypothetical protein
MQAELQAAAVADVHPEWAHIPNDAGTYDSEPDQTGFFSENNSNNYASPYGDFFIGTPFNDTQQFQCFVQVGTAECYSNMEAEFYLPLKIFLASMPELQ